MYKKVTCPTQIISHRLIIRGLAQSDEIVFGQFMDLNNQHFPQSYLKWPYDGQGYASTYCDETIKYLNDAAIKRYYIFQKGKARKDIIGSIVITTDREHSVRVGYYIAPNFRKKGYGAEAHRATLREISKINPRQIIQAQCEKDNLASKRLLLKNGFKIAGARMPVNLNYQGSGNFLLTFRRVL